MKKVIIEVDGNNIGFNTEGYFADHELHGLFLSLANHIQSKSHASNMINLLRTDRGLHNTLKELVLETDESMSEKEKKYPPPPPDDLKLRTSI